MRSLSAVIVATALFAISAASVATAAKPTFSGERTVDASGRLHVSFTELGVGKQALSYRLQATGEVTFTCGGVFYGTGGFGGVSWRDPSQHTTIQAERGRASGMLWHETLLTSPTCRPDEFGQIPAIGRSAISWTDITVTSSSGAILRLEDIAAPTP
jgi:hypothetical protein